MTQFEQKSFSVQMGGRKPEGCEHGWMDKNWRCVMCGESRYTAGFNPTTVAEAWAFFENLPNYCDEGE